MNRRRIARSVGLSALLQAGNYVFALALTPFLARVLGLSGYGLYSYCVSAFAYLWIIVDWGFSLAGVRTAAALASDAEALKSYFWAVVSAKVLLAFAAFLAIAPFFFLSNAPTVAQVGCPLAFAACGAILSADWLVQGLEKFGTYTVVTLTARAMGLALMITFVHSPDDSVVAIVIQGGMGLASAICGLVVMRHLGLFVRIHWDFPRGLRLIREGTGYFFSQSSVLLWTAFIPMTLSPVSGIASVALFVGADKINKVALATLLPLSSVLYPRVSALIAQGERRSAAQLVAAAVIVQLIFGVLVALSMYVLAPYLVRFLLGPELTGAQSVLRCLAPSILLVACVKLLSLQVLYPLGHATKVGKAVLVATAFSLVAIIPLASWKGAEGAALTYALMEVVQAILLSFAVLKYERAFAYQVLSEIRLKLSLRIS